MSFFVIIYENLILTAMLLSIQYQVISGI